MAFTVYVQMKRLGKQKRGGIEKTAFTLEQKPETAGELIEGLVRLSVRAYNARKDEGQLLPWLTGEEIAAMASVGKVSFGVRGGGDQDEEKAVANALRCFEAGDGTNSAKIAKLADKYNIALITTGIRNNRY